MSMALGQSDPLASKSIGLMFADADHFWAVAADGAHYSRIDPFPDPADIRNGSLPFRGVVRGGSSRSSSLVLFFNYAVSDSVTVAGLAAVGGDNKSPMDSLVFVRSKAHNNSNTLGIEFSALQLRKDSVLLGAGRAGLGWAKLRPENGGVFAQDSIAFSALITGVDTLVPALRCAVDANCPVDGLDAAAKLGAPDSVSALAIDSSAADSIWILVGTQTGLRRGLWGGKAFPKVALPADKPDAPIRIESIHADASHRVLWVFSGSEYFFSDDHGKSFHKPPVVAALATKPTALSGFLAPPEVAVIGDTSFLNFNLDRPGLVAFNRDTMTANSGTGDFGDVVLDHENGLDIARGEGRLTTLAVLSKGSVTALAAGSLGKGMFLRKTGTGETGGWKNINSLKALQGGLSEVITFPTLFTGINSSGPTQYTNIGYRLKRDGKITITVYNYGMEKVRTLVKDAPRKGGGSRSENPSEDRWDGTDTGGRPVSFGTYYILVQSDQGEKGWGKAIAVHGRNP